MNVDRKDPVSDMSALKSLLPKNSTRPLLLGLLVMVLLMGMGMGIGIYQLRLMATTLERVAQENETAREAIYTMNRVTRNRALLMTEILETQDPFERDEKLLEFDRLAGGFNVALQRQRELSVTAAEKAELARQMQLTQTLIGYFDRVVTLARRDELATATVFFQDVTIPTQSVMLDTLMHWAELHYAQHNKRVKETQDQQHQVISMMFAVALISILVGLLVAWVVYRWNGRLIAGYVENEKHLNATLAELAFRQRALDAHSIVSEADVQGRITYVNDKFCEVSGYSWEELIGASHRIVKSDCHPPEFFQAMWETISSGQVWHGEVRNRAKNGQHYWVETTIVPMLDEAGLPMRYISVRTDITRIMEMKEAVRQANVILESNVIERTHELEQAKQQLEQELRERVQTQAALQQSYDELKNLHRQLQDTQQYLMQSEKMAAVGQLAAGMAHEINNPIGFVTANLSMLNRYQATLDKILVRYRQCEAELGDDARTAIAALRQESDLDFVLEDTRALLEETRSGVERVHKIVQDLRDFSRLDSAGEWLQVDLNQCLNATLNLLGGSIAKGVAIHREYGQLPLVECSPAEINQVLMNVLNNALQALRENGSITLRSGVAGEQVWVEIEDTGEGISEETLPHIFDPFFTTRPVGQGAGLGLSTAYGVIQKHGGLITVSSRMGQGSMFRITLPQRQHGAACSIGEVASQDSCMRQKTHVA